VHVGPSTPFCRVARAGFGGAPLSARGYFVLADPGHYGRQNVTMANRKDFGYGELRDICWRRFWWRKKYPILYRQPLGLTGCSYGAS